MVVKRRSEDSVNIPSKKQKKENITDDIGKLKTTKDETIEETVESSEDTVESSSKDSSSEENETLESDEDSDDDYSEEESLQDIINNIKTKSGETYDALIEVQKEISRTEPDITKILTTPMRIEDRTKIIMLWEIYKNIQPNTDEWLTARENVNKTFKDYKAGYKQHAKYTEEEHAKIQSQINNFGGYDSKLAIKYNIMNLDADLETKEIIYRKYEEFIITKPGDDEHGKLKNWLHWATSVPHDKIKPLINNIDISTFLKTVSLKLDKELYGMKSVKEQLLLFLNTKLLNPSMKKCNLGLVGPAGVGKTRIAQVLSEVTEFPMEQIFCGGASTPEFFKGHDYTYVGSGPGEIVKCLARLGCKNGVIYMDEYEKTAENSAVCAALLGITDPSQNSKYRDLFLSDFTIDLSNIWWIKSMNSLPTDSALRDRIFSISVPGYNFREKVEIIKNHLLEKACTNAGLDKDAIKLDKGVASLIVNKVCTSEDKGVRTIEKTITDVVNKINFIVTHQSKKGIIDFFDMSFDPKEILSFPVTITKSILDKLIADKDIDMKLASMYV